MNILIAEDDPISRAMLSGVLEDMGHSVTAAENGNDAWRMYQAVPTRLVVSDWLMPKMDGLELVEKIRSHDLSDYTYIIMLTANCARQDNYLKAMGTGVDDFLTKPLDPVELEIRLKVAQRILQSSSRIQSLENVLTICAYTKKINFPEEGWQSIEHFMKRHLGITLSHGIEPNYYENVIQPQIEQMERVSQQADSFPAPPAGHALGNDRR